MPVLNDLPALLGVWIAGVLLLVPICALAARWGLVPVLHAVARLRAAGRGAPEADERFAGVEAQLRALGAAVDRLAESLERERAAQP